MREKINLIMVPGAGRGQIPIIKCFQRYGCSVITVSPKGDYPGFSVADESVIENVGNLDNLLAIAQEKQINGIATDQLDIGVLSSAYVAEKMNLRGIGYNVAQKFTNKALMREAADLSGVKIPEYFQVNDVLTAKQQLQSRPSMHFPLMMKPVDASASRGVHKVESIGDIEDFFADTKKWSNTGSVIIEQFIEGREYVVDAYTHDYESRELIVGHREYFNVQGAFIPKATLFVDAESADTEAEMRIKEENSKLIKGLGLEFGITHAEYLYNDQTKEIYLVEIAARGGGVFISSEIIPAATGIDATDLFVRDILGLEVDNSVSMQHRAAAYFCYLLPEGTISGIEGVEEVSRIPGVRRSFFDNVFVGMQTGPLLNKAARKGPIIVEGDSQEECLQVYEKIKRTLKIQVDTSEGLKGIIWC